MKLKNKQIESNTPPSIWLRIKASLIDYLVILLWIAVIGVVGFTLSVVMGGYPDYLGLFGPVGTQIIFFFVLTFPVGLYLFLTEASSKHATLGKRKVGIKVARSFGDQAPSKKSIALRTIIKLLPWEIAHTFIWQMQYAFYQNGYDADIPVWIFIGLNIPLILVIIYVVMIVVRRDTKGPHDIIAGTRVAYCQAK